MEQLLKGEYIEHWENGVGKIVAVDERKVTVEFMKKGKMELEEEKTVSFKRLNPEGLLAQMCKNLDRMQDLAKQGSTEIIRLLILDESKDQNNEIERSRIKLLLTKGKPSTSGWRRDFGLIEEGDWKKWWTGVSKKLTKDPWFDTKSKKTIALREEPISEPSVLYEQFLNEKRIEEKALLLEKLAKFAGTKEGASFAESLIDFVNGVLRDGLKGGTLHLAVLAAIQLKAKGRKSELFNENAHDLTLSTLLESGLSSQKLTPVYSFFSKMPPRNTYDHLVIYIVREGKIRETICKFLKGKISKKKAGKLTFPQSSLTKEHVEAINILGKSAVEALRGKLIELGNKFNQELVTEFLTSVLLSDQVDRGVKAIFSQIVAGKKMKDVIYKYLNNVNLSQESQIAFANDFFYALSPTDAEWALLNIVFNERALLEKPKVALAALKIIASDTPILDPRGKRNVIAHICGVFSLAPPPWDEELKLQVGKIMAETEDLGKLEGSYQSSDLGRIARTRGLPLNQRLDAIEILIKRNAVTECRSIIGDLASEIEKEDFTLLESVYRAFPDRDFANDIFKKMIDKPNVSNAEVLSELKTFLRHSSLMVAFAESILSYQDYSADHVDTIRSLAGDEEIGRTLVKTGVEAILRNEDVHGKIGERVASCFPPEFKWILEQVRETYTENMSALKSSSEAAQKDFEEERQGIIDDHRALLMDAVEKTSQRYEEYIKKLLPVLGELEELKRRIEGSGKEISSAAREKEMLDKVSVIKEDVEWVLKVLKVVVRP
ncbi:MAG: hypothetical protein KKH04_15465 [Proteobacteria bacterium]|nr:hypothetical protein [Pseudomonadota bacterium]